MAVRVLGGELDARSRRQALRALLVLHPLGARTRIELPDPGALLRKSPGEDIAGLGLELGLAGVRPPASWSWTTAEASDATLDAATVAELLVWAVLASEEDGTETPKSPADALDDGLPKLYVHHDAVLKVLGSTLDVDEERLMPILYDKEGNVMDPNA